MQARDKEKKELCAGAGITLLDVPYWWDGSHGSLAATIHKARPDIPIPQRFLVGAAPISATKGTAGGEKRTRNKKKLTVHY